MKDCLLGTMRKSANDETSDDETTTSSSDPGSTMEEEDEEGGQEEAKQQQEEELEEDNNSTRPMNEQEMNGANSPPSLSKSWAIEHAHVPIFTGGKICPLYLKGNQQQQEEQHSTVVSCLFLPVNGDLAIVDAQRGTKLGAVRATGSGTLNHRSNTADHHDNDDDDDEGLDQDAITAYAFSEHENSLVTCSHSHLLQQYSVQLHVFSDDEQEENHNSDRETANHTKQAVAVTLEKTLGRSGHSLPVVHMEFHKSGVFLATASVDGTCRILDVRVGHVTHIYRPLAGGSGGGSGRLSVTSIRWMDDTSHLVIAIGRDDGSIAIHDLRDTDMKRIVILRDHLSAVTSMDWWWKNNNQEVTKEPSSFFPSVFVTAGRDAVINIWKIDNNPQKALGKKKTKKHKKDLTDTDHRGVPVYKHVRTLPLYEEIEGMILLPSDPDSHEDSSLRIATAGSKGAVRLWISKDNSEGDIADLLSVAEQPVAQAYGKERGGYLRLNIMKLKAEYSYFQLVVADAEHSLSFLSLSGHQDEILRTERTIVGFNDEVLDLKIIPSASSEGSQIVVVTNSAQVRIFAMDTFSCHVLNGHTATVLCVDVSPCGRYIATCGKDNRMCLWHTESRKCIATAVGHTEAVGATALSRKKGK